MITGKQLKALATLASKDTGKSNLSCIWLDGEGGGTMGKDARIWACDGHQLSMITLVGVTGPDTPQAYALDAISRLKAKDEIRVDVSNDSSVNGGRALWVVPHGGADAFYLRELDAFDTGNAPDVDAATPELLMGLVPMGEAGQRLTGIGFGLLQRVTKAVCGIMLDRDAGVRFQIGDDAYSPMRYDYEIEPGVLGSGVVMPMRVPGLEAPIPVLPQSAA